MRDAAPSVNAVRLTIGAAQIASVGTQEETQKKEGKGGADSEEVSPARGWRARGKREREKRRAGKSDVGRRWRETGTRQKHGSAGDERTEDGKGESRVLSRARAGNCRPAVIIFSRLHDPSATAL